MRRRKCLRYWRRCRSPRPSLRGKRHNLLLFFASTRRAHANILRPQRSTMKFIGQIYWRSAVKARAPRLEVIDGMAAFWQISIDSFTNELARVDCYLRLLPSQESHVWAKSKSSKLFLIAQRHFQKFSWVFNLQSFICCLCKPQWNKAKRKAWRYYHAWLLHYVVVFSYRNFVSRQAALAGSRATAEHHVQCVLQRQQ